MALFRPLHIGLATSAAFLASTAFAQSTGKLLFDLSNFSNQSTANLSASSGLLSNLTFQTYDGNQMQTVKGGAGLLKTQYAQGSQAAFDLSRNDWFYTLCVEPTAWLINGATSEISTTKDWQQPWKTPSDPKAGDSLALLYHNFGNRTPAFAGSPLVANTVGEQVGLQVAFWEIVNDFDSTKTDFGLDLSKGLFNFKFAYADGSTNRQEISERGFDPGGERFCHALLADFGEQKCLVFGVAQNTHLHQHHRHLRPDRASEGALLAPYRRSDIRQTAIVAQCAFEPGGQRGVELWGALLAGGNNLRTRPALSG